MTCLVWGPRLRIFVYRFGFRVIWRVRGHVLADVALGAGWR